MTRSTGAGPSVYIIKRGVLLIIIHDEHVDTITAMFHLCNKFNRQFSLQMYLEENTPLSLN